MDNTLVRTLACMNERIHERTESQSERTLFLSLIATVNEDCLRSIGVRPGAFVFGIEMSKILNKRKRNIISLDTKLGVIERLKEGLSMAAVAKEFGIGKSTVHDIKKMEKDLVNWGDRENNNEEETKPKMVYIKHEKLEDAVFNWCLQEIEEGRECRDTDIRRVAERFAECIGVANFATLSGGWLSRFKKRFNLENLGEDILNHSIFPLTHGLQVYTEEEIDAEYGSEEPKVPVSDENSREADLRQRNLLDPPSSEALIKEKLSLFNEREGVPSCAVEPDMKFKMSPEDHSTTKVKGEPNDTDAVTDDSTCSPAAVTSSALLSTSTEKVFHEHENVNIGVCLSKAKEAFLTETPVPFLAKFQKVFNIQNLKPRNNNNVTFSMTLNDKISPRKETNKNKCNDDYGLMINSMISEMELTQQVLAKFYILKVIDMGKKQNLFSSGVVL